MEDRDILADKENLTVWLVKKIFLEGKEKTKNCNLGYMLQKDSLFEWINILNL